MASAAFAVLNFESSTVLHRGPSELQLYAIQLVDKYFGADYDGDMAAS